MTDPVSGDGTFSANVASACHRTSQERWLVASGWPNFLIADSKMITTKTPRHQQKTVLQAEKQSATTFRLLFVVVSS
jgi:hypothetical protein